MKRIFIALALIVSTCFVAQGQTLPRYPFLRVNPDVRSAAMGGAPTAAGMHIYNIPAGAFKQLESFSLGYTVSAYPQAGHDNLFDGAMHHSASATLRIGQNHALMAGFRSLNQPEVLLSNAQSQATRSYRPLDWSADLGYSLRLGQLAPWVRLGYVQSLTDRVARAVNASVGVYYSGRSSLAFTPVAYGVGVAMHDLGTRIDQDKIDLGHMPTSLEVHGDFTMQVLPSHSLTLAAYGRTFTPISGGQWMAGGGMEYEIDRSVMLRAGYQNIFDQNYLTFGLGLNLHPVGLNVSYVTSTSSTPDYNRLSLGVTCQF